MSVSLIGQNGTSIATTINGVPVFTGDALIAPKGVGAIRNFSENDSGALTGVPLLRSPEADVDYRQRVSQDIILDDEVFNYTSQNTGKHSSSTNTMTNTWTAGQLTTNGSGITTVGTGTVFNTYACFPMFGTTTLSGEFQLGFSAQPQTNTIVEFGMGIPSATTVAPSDGVFFRLTSAGLMGVASFNGTETVIGPFPATNGTGTWTYANSTRYQFICYASTTEAQFWVKDGTGTDCLGTIPQPAAQSRMFMSSGVQAFLKHRIVGGAAGGVLQTLLGAYNVRLGGTAMTTTPSTNGLRIFGSYQGLGGGTLGTLARVGAITAGNEANVAPAVPTTTTAALGSGLGGTFWETVSLAVNTDAIIMSYQVPANTPNIQGRRLVLRGMYLSSHVQTVIVGGPYVAEYFLAFGHTAASLGSDEGGTTKAPRRIALPFTQVVTAAQAVSTLVSQPVQFVDFGDAPVFVNPGEFIQLCTRHIGVAGTTGTVVHRVTPIFGWE